MTSQTPSPLTVSAMTAYLVPLLEKHEKEQVLVYEDLTASLQATEILFKQHSSGGSNEADLAAAKEQIAALHKEQLQAYQQTAKHALQEYAKNVRLLPATGTKQQHPSSSDAFVQLCLRSALERAPGWKIPRSAVLAVLQKIIPERALQLYRQQQATAPSKSTNCGTKEVGEQSEEEEGEEVEAETGEEEEGEEDEDDDTEDEDAEDYHDSEEDNDRDEEGEVSEEKEAAANTTKGISSNKVQKRKGILAKKRAATVAKGGKATPRKKNEKVKATGPKPNRGGSRRPSRRGGRGGSNVK